VEIIKPRQENPSPSLQNIDLKLTKLLDPNITKDDWKTYWKNPNFTELFPNLIFRLISLEGRSKYTEEQKQRIFELGFASFMESPWQYRKGGIIKEVNQETQLWEKTRSQQVRQDTETLITIENGSLILLGLGLKNKEDAINLITETYNNSKVSEPYKAKTFRYHVMNKLIIKKSAFGQWVRANNLDVNNDFEWDREVARLGLKLFYEDQGIAAQDTNKRRYENLPPEFKNLENYPAQVITQFVDYILAMQITTKNTASQINVFATDLETMLRRGDFHDDSLFNELEQKLNRLREKLRSL